MSTGNRYILTAILVIAAFGAWAAPPSEQPMTLELVSPLPPANSTNARPPARGPNATLPIEFRAGWPLIYRASVKAGNMIGIGKIYGSADDFYTFPEVAGSGAIVYSDPDGIWSYSDLVPYAHDETFTDVYPDVGDVSGQDDPSQSPYALSPAEKLALRPEFGGPHVGSGDGVQYGADDDFPGLVILSNIGVGVVLDSLAAGGNPAVPRQARNLAGFTNSVGYELSDKLSRTSITSVMIVPRYLFTPIRWVDECVGTPTEFDELNRPAACSGAPEQRIDGGEVEPLSAYPDESLVEIRAFVVQPVWNSVSARLDYLETLVDMNGDGQVTAEDAKLAGWKVISNEVVTQVRTIGNAIDHCFRGSRPDAGDLLDDSVYVDIDGNSYSQVFGPEVCPGGGSGVTQPPR
jgi:hypothetical protein